MQPEIRAIRPDENDSMGNLMVEIYSKLQGFPSPQEQPDYYQMLRSIGQLNEIKNTRVFVALAKNDEIVGGVVYFSDMAQYGSGGIATQVKHASGIRLLGVHPNHRGQGIGKALVWACIEQAKQHGHHEVILHTTESMKTAWSLYESMGFKRSPDLDFMQEKLQVLGFRLDLRLSHGFKRAEHAATDSSGCSEQRSECH